MTSMSIFIQSHQPLLDTDIFIQNQQQLVETYFHPKSTAIRY